ncbi:hypothetical protein N665_0366s0013 [Sinapis alba]|nr:hypothetical protein N665_0366s0013 [Sinapis alba]
MENMKKPKYKSPCSSPTVSVESPPPSLCACVSPPPEGLSNLAESKLPEPSNTPASSCPAIFQSYTALKVDEPEESIEATSGHLSARAYPQRTVQPVAVSAKDPPASHKPPLRNGKAVQTSLWKEKVKAPARGAVHAIVNGMWSKYRRDIVVSKMEGNAFLFRVPCSNAHRRILSQCLWQVDGQTLFVAKWSLGVKPEKPSLATVPIWLDLEEIAGLVGHPICLHPSMKNLSNIELACVYTVIDPRKPLPKAVNAQFESGEMVRIKVFHVHVGHTISCCPAAPPRCEVCHSIKHATADSTRTNANMDGSRMFSEKQHGKAHIPSQFHIVGSVAANAKRPKNPPKAGSKKKKPPVEQWIPTTNITKDPPNTIGRPIDVSQQLAPSSHDLSLGEFFLDLCVGAPNNETKSPVSSSSYDTNDIESEGLSNEDDNPNDEGDQFIRVISQRSRKKAKATSRVIGPLTL